MVFLLHADHKKHTRLFITTKFCNAKSNILWTTGEDIRVRGKP